MTSRRLLWQLFPSYVGIVLLTLIPVILISTNMVYQIHLEDKTEELKSRALLVEQQINGLIQHGQIAELDSLISNIGKASGTRITVIKIDGKVLGDSQENAAQMENHADRPEIVAALKQGMGISSRYSYTIEKELLYVAIPLIDNGKPIAILRTSIPIKSLNDTIFGFTEKLIMAGLVIAFLVLLISLVVSRHLSKPLMEIQNGIERFAGGDLKHRISEPRNSELGQVTHSLNEMASRLDHQIRMVIRQRNEQLAVLESMREGVIAIDLEETILNINTAAADLMDTTPEEAQGKILSEIIRNAELQALINSAVARHQPFESEIVLRVDAIRYLQVRGSLLKSSSGRVIGIVVVLNDVTRLRRLETVRRDFVANVSHEIRTPLTSIKGFAETLLDSNMEDKEELRNFMGIIARQANRLNAIIDDLLSLARLEQDDNRESMIMDINKLRPAIDNAIQVCQPAAEKKRITFQVECEPSIETNLNPALLEQAMVNLIDNAVKYSPEEKRVFIRVETREKEISISVDDEGIGIEKKHLPRLFERFYRADKARSRAMGGTGLGLSIVKHIAQVHNGRVGVESEVGSGSSFSIYLPLPVRNEEKSAGS